MASFFMITESAMAKEAQKILKLPEPAYTGKEFHFQIQKNLGNQDYKRGIPRVCIRTVDL